MAVGGTVSGLVGLVAAAIPDGSRVLVPEIEFASDLFPFLVQERRGVEVTTVPFDGLLEAIDDSVDIVVTSAVQMSTGELVDVSSPSRAPPPSTA